MNRNALCRLIQRWLLAASLPVTAAGCNGLGSQDMLSPCLPDLYHPVLLPAPSASWPDGGALPIADCQTLCKALVASPGDVVGCAVIDNPYPNDLGDASVAKAVQCDVIETVPCHTGRRPEGLQTDGEVTCADPVASLLARMAHLEDAAAHAFAALAEELEFHGAPASLLVRARRAVREERSHARAVSGLARLRGAEPVIAIVERPPIRDLATIAIDNASEGCVGETWGAVLATRQGQLASDPGIRRVMRSIARDETRHGELSWEIDAWIRTRLEPEAIGRLDEARNRAMTALRHEVNEDRREEYVLAQTGLPARKEALRLLSMMERELIGAARAA